MGGVTTTCVVCGEAQDHAVHDTAGTEEVPLSDGTYDEPHGFCEYE